MKFRKKPVVIEAVQWLPSENGNQRNGWPSGFKQAGDWLVSPISLRLFIPTLEGEMTAQPGDWVIKGVNGEFYPCKPDIFEKTYESVE